MRVADRIAVLREHGARNSEIEELLGYTHPTFDLARVRGRQFPLDDEPFVATWSNYVAEAGERGVWPCLRDKLVQLRFPILEGICHSSEYRAATRQGDLSSAPEPDSGMCLRAPDRLRLSLHRTPAGRMPVLIAEDRRDFVALVRALVHRNQPHSIPDGQGACIVAGYNNWDRVHRMRDRWRLRHPAGTDAEWQAEFRALIPSKELYQDRFILLSVGPYSGVPATDLGIGESSWRHLSLRIRLEHECAHYFTRRVLGSMTNSLHDELIADYVGLTVATGSFRAEWFLRFMGLDRPGVIRPEGRLHNYRGNPRLSPGAFRALQRLVRSAAYGVAALHSMAPPSDSDNHALVTRILTLADETVESLAVLGLTRYKAHV